MDVDGLTCWHCSHEMDVTADRLRLAIERHEMTIFAVIDHGREAAEVGLELGPMQLVFFGAAQAGTKLMQTAPTTGIDLPLRILLWTDINGAVWLGYNEPGWIAARHGARISNDLVLADMRRALSAIAEMVTHL